MDYELFDCILFHTISNVVQYSINNTIATVDVDFQNFSRPYGNLKGYLVTKIKFMTSQGINFDHNNLVHITKQNSSGLF